MKRSLLSSLVVVPLATLSSLAAAQEPTGARQIAPGVQEVDTVWVNGRPSHPQVAAEIAKAALKVELAPLKQPLAERIEQALDSGPF